jgi:hypothetical protein
MSDRWSADALGAISHPTYRDWASEALGDERQVYARSMLPSANLVFLPDGAADLFREAARRQELICPVPGCPSPLLTTRGPVTRRHHFVHLQAPADREHQRAYVRRVATELLANWIKSAHPQSTYETDVRQLDLEIAVLVTGPSGARFAILFVDHRLGVDAWREAEYKLRADHLAAGWIFAPRQFLRYPQPSPDASPDDPVVADARRRDVVLDRALFREMRREGRWPLVLSVERKELANLIPPGGVVATRLRLAPPVSGDRVLHLVPCRLDACRLGREGIETPNVPADVLAAPRLAREQRERHLTRLRQHREQALGQPSLQVHAEPIMRPRAEAEERRPVTALIRAAVVAAGPVTTFAALLRELDMFERAQEQKLRGQLYSLRDEGVVEFHEPLSSWSGIRFSSK